MQEVLGKSCPYCQSPIKEQDTVVICSTCDMPHHEECWLENSGCTTFGCRGEARPLKGRQSGCRQGALDNDRNEPPRFCTRCGRTLQADSSFCGSCGASVGPTVHSSRPNAVPPVAVTVQVSAATVPDVDDITITSDINNVDVHSPVDIRSVVVHINRSGRVYCTVEMYNRAEKPIHEISLGLTFFDESGKPCDTPPGDYVRVLVDGENALHGWRIARRKSIVLPQHSVVRRITVAVEEVTFSDGMVWLRDSSSVIEVNLAQLQGDELVALSELMGDDAYRYAYNYDTAWHCVCGYVNHSGRVDCGRCGRTYSAVIQYTSRERVEESLARLILEKEEKTKDLREKARKVTKNVSVVILALGLIAGAYVLAKVVAIPGYHYSRAMKLQVAGNYNDAIELFSALGEFKDSPTMILESKYQSAYSLLEDKLYDTARVHFRLISDYKDASEMILECSYREANDIFTTKQYAAASGKYLSLGDYKDSKEKYLISIYLLARDARGETRRSYYRTLSQHNQDIKGHYSYDSIWKEYATLTFDSAKGLEYSKSYLAAKTMYEELVTAKSKYHLDSSYSLSDLRAKVQEMDYRHAVTMFDSGQYYEAYRHVTLNATSYTGVSTLKEKSIQQVYDKAMLLYDDALYTQAKSQFDLIVAMDGSQQIARNYGFYSDMLAAPNQTNYESLLSRISEEEVKRILVSPDYWKYFFKGYWSDWDGYYFELADSGSVSMNLAMGSGTYSIEEGGIFVATPSSGEGASRARFTILDTDRITIYVYQSASSFTLTR